MSERKGSLVSSNEMDEPLFDGRSQNCVPRTESKRYTASSGCERRHGQKVRNETRAVFAGLTEEVREEPSYKETKAKEAGRTADGPALVKRLCESRAEGKVFTGAQPAKGRRRVHCESKYST